MKCARRGSVLGVQSWEGSNEFAGGFPMLRPGTARLPRLAPAEPRNDNLGSASLPCHCEEGASPTWQSQVGTCEFAGAFLCSGVYCEIAAAPAEPRNDKSGGFPHPEGRNDKSENRCGRRAASANPYAISGNCYISQSADKSTHLGFIVAISASFLLRDQLFICFSRSIAALTSGVVSK